MRLKSLLLLVSLFVASSTFATVEEPSLRARGPRAREGRAVIVHPAGPLTESDRSELAAQGVHVKQVLTGGRYLARVGDDVQVDDRRVVRVERLTADHKIHRSAYRAVAAGRTSFRAHVMFQRDVDFDAAREAILAAGGALDPLKVSFSPSQRIDATIPAESLTALASDDRVFAVAAARNWKVQSDNAAAASVSGVPALYEAPYGLTGAGVTLSLFELARGQADHVEFGGRYTTTVEGGASSDGMHATHVAGTMIAAGIRPAAKGMAPGASLHQFCVSTPCGGKMTYLDDKDEVLPTLGVVADNNSWGFVLGWSSESGYPVWNDAEEYFGAYELFTAAPIDEISIRRNILFVHSAGNEGSGQTFTDESSAHRHVDDQGDTITDKLFCYSRNQSGTDCGTGCNGGCELTRHMAGVPFDTIGVTAAAKNILTVGNLITDSGPFNIASSSSRGPAKDGRVKPDVVARGTRVLSSVPTNQYQTLGGTSMAAPVVTGIAALVTEQWRRTFSRDPGPAHLKAVIIAGAEDLGNPGPDYTYGFGLVNAKNSVDIVRADGGQSSRIRDLTVAQGQTVESLAVVSAEQPFRAVLHWADPAIASLGDIDGVAEKALVNDLDIRVVDPSGVEHRAWTLDKSAPTANATRGTNTVDNTEVVEIANAAPGIYRVFVTGTSVMQGPQSAVLVLSARAAAPCRDIQETGTSNNNTQEAAFGNLVPGQLVNAGLCSAGDVDFYRLNVTKAGPVSVAVTTGDTAVRVALSGAASASRDIPANSTGTISANASSPGVVYFRVEALGPAGAEPQYSFVPEFGQTNQPRRRAGGR